MEVTTIAYVLILIFTTIDYILLLMFKDHSIERPLCMMFILQNVLNWSFELSMKFFGMQFEMVRKRFDKRLRPNL